ncbi:SDR family NAD(P)-dependent oxidoreductase [Phycicoccus duodecadis]|uniref:Short-subunit dehydrogenase n=1 Tax=Phycicoccus duodecadis TaxID=173053 RepID=A0A2N3YF84_9MICO|nr:SDR family oxidoreductase [Phycicoccus duodecadis]PKW25505.1 short-subunit dehydrogenase [Phycicoccus duodecadis]
MDAFDPDTASAPVAIVAGASRGLGLEIARQLVGRGWRVHVLARDADTLRRAAFGSGPGRALTHVADVSDADAVSRVVDLVLADEGRLDAAFHVAGTIQVGALDGVTLGHLHEAVDTMLWGPVHLSLAVLPAMRAQGHGRIGVVSSVGGLVAVPRLLPYSVAKFAAVGLAEGLAAELSGTGVTVTAVTPWLMRTGGHRAARFSGAEQADHAWFSLAASLPVLTVPVERAARRIIDGVLAGRVTVTASPVVGVVRRVHGLAPATTVRALGLGARLLPGTSPRRDWWRRDAPATDGAALERTAPRAVTALATLGRRAARRQNEPDPVGAHEPG